MFSSYEELSILYLLGYDGNGKKLWILEGYFYDWLSGYTISVFFVSEFS